MLAQSSKTQNPIVRKFPTDLHTISCFMKYHSFWCANCFQGGEEKQNCPFFQQYLTTIITLLHLFRVIQHNTSFTRLERMLKQFQEHDADDGKREEEEEGGHCGCLLIARYWKTCQKLWFLKQHGFQVFITLKRFIHYTLYFWHVGVKKKNLSFHLLRICR